MQSARVGIYYNNGRMGRIQSTNPSGAIGNLRTGRSDATKRRRFNNGKFNASTFFVNDSIPKKTVIMAQYTARTRNMIFKRAVVMSFMGWVWQRVATGATLNTLVRIFSSFTKFHEHALINTITNVKLKHIRHSKLLFLQIFMQNRSDKRFDPAEFFVADVTSGNGVQNHVSKNPDTWREFLRSCLYVISCFFCIIALAYWFRAYRTVYSCPTKRTIIGRKECRTHFEIY